VSAKPNPIEPKIDKKKELKAKKKNNPHPTNRVVHQVKTNMESVLNKRLSEAEEC
jgi:hypothetical protein